MGKSSPDTHETISSAEPPEYIKPYIQHALGQAQGLYNTRGLYRDPSIPGMTQEGFAGAADVARDPMLLDPAMGLAESTIGGDFLGADALRTAARAELDDVIGGTRGQWESAGRSGSGLADYALGRGVTAALGQPYQRERAMQQQAGMMAPQMEAARYMPDQNLISLGLQQQGLEDKYYQEPWDRLARYTGIALGGAPAQLAGGTTIGQQPIYQPSPLSQIAGLGMMGAGLFL